MQKKFLIRIELRLCHCKKQNIKFVAVKIYSRGCCDYQRNNFSLRYTISAIIIRTMNKQLLSKLFSFNQSFRHCSYKPIKRPSLTQLKDPQNKHCNDESLKQPSLHEYLTAKIKAVGPITVAEYMKESLTNPNGGYYMEKDVFGQKGDFITSPEIGQIFGEVNSVAKHFVWTVSKY